MSLPFTRGQFLDLFRQYNDAIGLAPLLLIALAVSLVAVAHGSGVRRSRVIAAGLAALWLWAGIVYHGIFFARITPAATFFAAMFVAQAMLLLVRGVVRDRLCVAPRDSRAWIAGWILIAYAMVLYPVLGRVQGHGYPAGPSFGAPCPLVIYSLGVMLWTAGAIPISIVTIPFLWAIIGTSAATQLGIIEDYGLTVSALVVLVELWRRRPSRAKREAHRGTLGTAVGGD
jgi:hypothetical protein